MVILYSKLYMWRMNKDWHPRGPITYQIMLVITKLHIVFLTGNYRLFDPDKFVERARCMFLQTHHSGIDQPGTSVPSLPASGHSWLSGDSCNTTSSTISSSMANSAAATWERQVTKWSRSGLEYTLAIDAFRSLASLKREGKASESWPTGSQWSSQKEVRSALPTVVVVTAL